MLRHLIVAILVKLIRFYQIGISPLMGPCCRFTPTCSQYAIEVIRQDGPLRGGWRDSSDSSLSPLESGRI